MRFEGGISACGIGLPFKGIGCVITSLADQRSYSIACFDGHKMGMGFHRPPWVIHHRTRVFSAVTLDTTLYIVFKEMTSRAICRQRITLQLLSADSLCTARFDPRTHVHGLFLM